LYLLAVNTWFFLDLPVDGLQAAKSGSLMDHYATCEKGLKRTTNDNSHLSDQTERAQTLRAVKTIDFMTAKFAHLPFEFPEEVSRRIINEVQGISWVAYDFSSKPPVTIEWE
jgi:GMP synthase PP-ATPase subunit